MFQCQYCSYSSNRGFNVRTHEKRMHQTDTIKHGSYQLEPVTSSESRNDLSGVFDIRLKENFKLFVSGPSRCGKTVFISHLLENIHNFSKLPPNTVLNIFIKSGSQNMMK